MNNTMSIYEAITTGLSVKNSRSARVSENNVSIDTYAVWKAYEKTAFDVFYDYAVAYRKASTMGENATIDKAISDAAYTALQNLLNCIGEVNGYKIVKNENMLVQVTMTSVVVSKPLIGEALKQESIVKNLRIEVNNFHNGMNEEYMTAKKTELEAAVIKLSVLKKSAGSCETVYTRAKEGAFYSALENELATIINNQDTTPRSVLEAQAAARKAERDAKRKANKLAKQSAK